MTWIFITAPIIIFFLLILGPARLCVRWASIPDTPRMAIRFNLWKNVLGFVWIRENRINCFGGFVFNRPLLRVRRPMTGKPKPRALSEKKIEKKSKKPLLCFIQRLSGIAPKILHRLFCCMGIERFRIRGNIGLDNPAHTGLIYGIAQSLRPFQNEKVDVEIMPAFHRIKWECQADIVIRVIMAQLLFVVVRTGIQAGWAYRRCRH